MEPGVMQPAWGFIPVLLLAGVIALGILWISGGRGTGRTVGLPLLALLGLVLFFAWLVIAF